VRAWAGGKRSEHKAGAGLAARLVMAGLAGAGYGQNPVACYGGCWREAAIPRARMPHGITSRSTARSYNPSPQTIERLRTVKDFTVFFAWQSDTLQRNNRFLIRLALEEAGKRISNDVAIRTKVRIDSDTEGVLGQPPVSDTILAKIESCDVFAPDFTLVATTEGGKPVPNPNVMLEYGHALRAKGYGVMMPVMNTAHGPPEKLPFDMGHLRHPLQYRLEPTAKKAERRAVWKDLSEKFENILRLMIAATPSKPKDDMRFAEAKAVTPPAFFFKPSEVLAEFGSYESERQDYRFDSTKAIFLRLFPDYADQPTIGRAKVKVIFAARKPCPMSLTIGGISAENSHGSIILDPHGNSSIAGMTQGFPTGELWGLNSQPFRTATRPVFKGNPHSVDYLGMISVEKLFVRTLENYISIALGEYQLRPPFVVEAGGTGLLGVFAGVPSIEIPSGEFAGPFRSASFEKRYVLEDVQRDQISDVLRQFFDDFYDLAACSRSRVLTHAHIAENQLPPRTTTT
jgi:hypothetical protein